MATSSQPSGANAPTPEGVGDDAADVPASDVRTVERAYVDPDDINHLGDPEATQEKIEARLGRIQAEENTGKGLKAQVVRYGGLFVALAVGWWFGRQAAGGGGGGGEGGSSSSVSPIMLDYAAGAVETVGRAPALAVEAGTGVL